MSTTMALEPPEWEMTKPEKEEPKPRGGGFFGCMNDCGCRCNKSNCSCQLGARTKSGVVIELSDAMRRRKHQMGDK